MMTMSEVAHSKRPLMAVARFERLFRVAASIDVDKSDLRRHNDFVNRKLYDLLVVGEEVARLNGRKAIGPRDLPITKGLKSCIDAFRQIDTQLELDPILDQLAARPPLALDYGESLEAEFPRIVGGISVALARSFKIIDPELKNPSSTHWDRAFQLFDLLV